MIKKGFTLSELVMTIGVIGILALVVVPILNSANPNQELVMFRKAYYNAERIVTEMINDDLMYPAPNDNASFYFANTDEITYNGEQYSGDEKFARLFASKLALKGPVTCAGTSCTFTSVDGIVWTLPKTNFPGNASQLITVDVNADKAPDCAYGGGDTCIEPDRFNIKVYQKGVVEPAGVMEKEYLERKSVAKHAPVETFNKDEYNSSNIKFKDDPSLLVKEDALEAEAEGNSQTQPSQSSQTPKTDGSY